MTQMDYESEIFGRLANINDLFQSIFYKDNLESWSLARDLGEFLVRTEPEQIMGHAVLARAYRHLGDPARAIEELQICEVWVEEKKLSASEAELFLPFCIQERKLLGGDARRSTE